MLLSDYLKGKDIAKFAKAVGVKVPAVYHWMNGTREPRPDQGRLIVKGTNGEVTLEDLYGPGSWVILDETNKPVCEIFSKKEADIVNRKKKFKAIPIKEYLGDLNRRIAEGRI